MLFLMILLSSTSFAEERITCGAVTTANEVLECVKTIAPDAIALKEERDGAHEEARATQRWLNPEITNQTLFGKTLGNEQYEVQIGLMQTFELGARRSYKKALSEAIAIKAEANYTIGLGGELVQTGKDLLRLSQLRIEIASVEEAVNTFTRLINQFSSRPRLSPEQDVTLSVYRLSKGDFMVRHNELINERDEIYHRFKSRLNMDEELLEKVAVVKGLSFPIINIKDFPESTSPEVKEIDADILGSLSEVSLARSDSFSDIKFGPMVQFQSDGPYRSQLFGFQMTIPFPVWNQNGYGVEAAAKKLKAAEIRGVVRKEAVREEWKHLVENYGRLRTLLSQIPDPTDIESRHRKVEVQINRGLVTSALVVESHRSLIDLQKSRHSAERNALESLWHILIIQGKISEIRL